jgi:hypothetical protein
MRIRFMVVAAFLLTAGPLHAQTAARTPQAPKAPQPAPTVQAPAAPGVAPAPAARVAPVPPGLAAPFAREGQPINVKVDLTITEDGGGAPPVKKTVSAVVGDGFSSYVREQGMFVGGPNFATFERNVPLNLDATPQLLASGKIRLTCTIQYLSGNPPPPGENAQQVRSRTDIKQNLVLILESGKPLVVSEATDPINDRRVTVEVKATVLK